MTSRFIGIAALLFTMSASASPVGDCRAALDAISKASKGTDALALHAAKKNANAACADRSIPVALRAEALIAWSYTAPSSDAAAITKQIEKMLVEVQKSDAAGSDALPLLDRLAGIYSDSGRKAEALQLLDRGLIIRMKTFGDPSEETARGLYALGLFYQGQNQAGNAERFLKEAASSARQSCNAPCEILTASLGALHELLKSQPGREAEAARYEEEALATVP